VTAASLRRQTAVSRDVAARVGVVSDSNVVCFGVAAMLGTVDGVASVATMGLADVASGLARLDVVLIGGACLDDLTRVVACTRMAGGRALVLVEDVHAESVRDLLAIGADGYLLLDRLDAPRLAAALDQVRAGGVPMPAELLRDVLLPGLRERRGPAPMALTAREQDTLALLADGLSNKQIGRRLGISVHGAKRLVANILLKLGCPNRTSAVRRAVGVGLVQPEDAR
jgi:DNA-binding NarL/FixJ family response regulator